MTAAKSSAKYRSLLKRLELSHKQVEAFTHINARTSRRWASGDQEVPINILMLFAIMVEYGISPGEAREAVGLREIELPPAYFSRGRPVADN
jgi:hypothetical protein